MTRSCAECGREVPDDMDFCPHCGCRTTVSVNDTGMPEMACPSCGMPFRPGDRFCGRCGTSLPSITPQMLMPRMRKHAGTAVVVSLVAGFFNVFGLGHIILKGYARGAMFLVLSLIIWYLNGWSLFSGDFLIMLLTIAVYFYQVIDVSRVAMTPEDR